MAALGAAALAVPLAFLAGASGSFSGSLPCSQQNELSCAQLPENRPGLAELRSCQPAWEDVQRLCNLPSRPHNLHTHKQRRPFFKRQPIETSLPRSSSAFRRTAGYLFTQPAFQTFACKAFDFAVVRRPETRGEKLWYDLHRSERRPARTACTHPPFRALACLLACLGLWG